VLARLTLLALLLAAPGCDRQATPEPETSPGPETDRRPEGMPGETIADTLLAPVRDVALEAALREVVGRIEGDVGIAVLHFQSRTHASVNGDRPFPLASVYKLPIAYAALQRGGLTPADSVDVTAGDRAPGDTPFAPGTTAAVADLVRRSLDRSDNTASDVLLRMAGGPEVVTRQVHALGAAGVRVDRSMVEVFAAWREGGGAALIEDQRDSGTAEGIVALLAALHHGRDLDPEARRLLLESLKAADTGPNRIRAGVPPGTTVAHKTGTLGPLTHDVGIITLPAGRGEVGIAVLVRSDAPVENRELLIADAARTVWDRFAADGADAP
jgi:beta-lactamase class A